MRKVSRKHPVLHSAYCRTQEGILRTTQARGGGWEPAGAHRGKCMAQCGESHSWPGNKVSGESSLEAEPGAPGLDPVAQALTRVLPFLPFPSKCQAA